MDISLDHPILRGRQSFSCSGLPAFAALRGGDQHPVVKLHVENESRDQCTTRFQSYIQNTFTPLKVIIGVTLLFVEDPESSIRRIFLKIYKNK
jgi:hypothetical protein